MPFLQVKEDRVRLMHLQNLFDPTSALIVVGGTVLATVLRCGLADARASVAALRGLARPRFDAVKARAGLAATVRAMQRDGVIRVEPSALGDAELDAETGALVSARSLAALHEAHRTHKRRRSEQSNRAVRTFTQAADLAPVFGLAGTLVSLSQLPGLDGGGGSFTGAISMAVLTTLYGLLLGNILFAPLARVVARRAGAEERERQAVLDWLEGQVAPGLPDSRERSAVVAVVSDPPRRAGQAR